MRLLFDQNISFRVINGIKDIYPDAKQVRELNLENATDLEIWLFAKQEGYNPRIFIVPEALYCGSSVFFTEENCAGVLYELT